MSNFTQTLKGWFNKQSITTVQQKACIDIIPNDINIILDNVISSSLVNDDSLDFVKPDLELKNPLNGINANKYELMKNDFVHFSNIDDAIKGDASGALKSKYSIAARILNEQYYADFMGEFPQFAVQVVHKHAQLHGNDDEKSVKLFILLNFMYSECDIGVRP